MSGPNQIADQLGLREKYVGLDEDSDSDIEEGEEEERDQQHDRHHHHHLVVVVVAAAAVVAVVAVAVVAVDVVAVVAVDVVALVVVVAVVRSSSFRYYTFSCTPKLVISAIQTTVYHSPPLLVVERIKCSCS